MSDTDLLERVEASGPRVTGTRARWLPGWVPRGLAVLSGQPWRSAALGALIFGIIALAYWALGPRTYRAHATVAPAARSELPRLPGALGGIAGQLGLNVGEDPTNTPLFYALLGTSGSIERQVLFDKLPPRPSGGGTRTVWQALGVDPCDSSCILRTGLRRLSSAVDIVVDRETGTFQIAAVMKDPYDAAATVDLYLAAIERFNRGVRQTQARAMREFVEGRVAVVTGELHSAENDLQVFYERNVQWRTSPRLTFEEGRLRRVIENRTQLLNGLVQQLEAARLDEVNSTPLLSIIDSATPPVRKYSPRGLPLLIGGLVTGGLLGLLVGVLRIRARSD